MPVTKKYNLVDASCKASSVDSSQIGDEPFRSVVAQDTHCQHQNSTQSGQIIRNQVNQARLLNQLN